LYGRRAAAAVARQIYGRGQRKLLLSEKFSAVRPGYTGDEYVFSDYIYKKKETKQKREREIKGETIESRVVKSSRPGHSGAHRTIIKGGN